MDKLIFTAKETGIRLDKFLAENQREFTRSGLARLFNMGRVLLNGEPAAKNFKLQKNDKIEVLPADINLAASLLPQALPLQIVYDDGSIAVINKEKGMVVHPSSYDETGTLVNALLYRYKDKLSTVGGALRPGIVHRIDKDTSGLIVIAKNDAAHISLAKQTEEHTMLRRYLGVVRGTVKDVCGTIDLPIGRHPVHRTKKCVIKNGRRAVTHYKVLERCFKHTLMEFTLETGRTHQIRVHMAHIGHPIAGDGLYGISVKSLNGQCLHAETLGFTHPETGAALRFTALPPLSFEEFLNSVKLEDTNEN